MAKLRSMEIMTKIKQLEAWICVIPKPYTKTYCFKTPKYKKKVEKKKNKWKTRRFQN